MTIKSASDFADMRRAGRVVANIHKALREAAHADLARIRAGLADPVSTKRPAPRPESIA